MYNPPDAHITARKLLKILQIKDGEFGDRMLITGEKTRVEHARDMLESPVKIFEGFGQIAFRGKFEGKIISVGTSGKYAPEAAICVEKYLAAGVGTLIRVGSAGACGKEVKVGDLVIATGAVIDEGTSGAYAPEGYPAVCHPAITMALVDSCRKLKLRYHLGLVWTTDHMLLETDEFRKSLADLEVKAVDMATSPLLVLSSIYAARAGGIFAISDNLETGELGFMKPAYADAEKNALKVAFAALASLGDA
jgi:uridine phosphorylase